MPKFPRIPGCKILKKIGEGGTAYVYLGIHKKLNRDVAIKILKPELIKETDYVQGFVEEAKTASLEHTGVVSIYGAGEADCRLYIIMEYVQKNLKKQMARRKLPVDETLGIVKKIAEALQYAHSRGVVHMDINPANILLRPDGTPVITDFGLARNLGSNTISTSSGTFMGTPYYMSPEQCQGEKGGYASDIYSLGVVLFEMLSGRVPYKSDNRLAVLNMHLTFPLPSLPGGLRHYQPLIDGMMAKDKNRRFRDAGQVIDLIDRLKANENQEYRTNWDSIVPGPASRPVTNNTPVPVIQLEKDFTGEKTQRKNNFLKVLFVTFVSIFIVVLFIAFALITAESSNPVENVPGINTPRYSQGYSQGNEPGVFNTKQVRNGGQPVTPAPGSDVSPQSFQGGVVTFTNVSRRNSRTISVRLEIKTPLKSMQGRVIAADIYYTLDGSDPTRTNAAKYTGSPVVLRTNKDKLKARVIAKVGNYQGPVYSPTYTVTSSPSQEPRTEKPIIQKPVRKESVSKTPQGTKPSGGPKTIPKPPVKKILPGQKADPPIVKIRKQSPKPRISMVTDINQLDQKNVDEVIYRITKLEVAVKGIERINQTGDVVKIQLIISPQGKASLVEISGFTVEPANKMTEIKSALAREVGKIKFPPLTKNKRPVKAIIRIDFNKAMKVRNKLFLKL